MISDQSEHSVSETSVFQASYRLGFIILCTAIICLGAMDLLRFYSTVPVEAWEMHAGRVWIRLGGFVAAILTVAGWLVFTRGRLETRGQVTTTATLMLIIVGTILIATRLVLQKAVPTHPIFGIVDLLVLHLLACLFLPWTPKESVPPFALLLLLWAVSILAPRFEEIDILDRVVGAIISPAILVPGALIAGWRSRRRQEDLERLQLGQQVRDIGGELSRARIVHDAMFPPPSGDGAVEFDYEYVPIAEIGGDYVHLHRCRDTGKVCLTLLDVAGHGLAAALTVNRLFGELERIRAENPKAAPGDVMSLLNRYIFLTMARHNLYATGACFELDPANGNLTWVNAGHPPAMLRQTTGSVSDVPGTTIMLGVESPDEFEPNEQVTTLRPGDVVIAYTDGAFEARDRNGKRLGIDLLRRTAAFDPPPRSWTKFMAHAVAQHHEGNADDDVLIASLTLRSLRVGRPAAIGAETTGEVDATV